MALDSTSLESLKSYGNTPSRVGILFGAVDPSDPSTVIVDAIYECSQDAITGERLPRDSRMPMVTRISGLMGLKPVGILVPQEHPVRSTDIVDLCNIEGIIAHTLLKISSGSHDTPLSGFILTPRCIQHVREGTLTKDTTLEGPTVNGGLDGKLLFREILVVPRAVNTVIHTGFYRLNRPNHTPTFEDVRAFIAARQNVAKISDYYLQLADYHLILFIADSLGEPVAERIILAIFQEDNELVEDLVEMLMSGAGL